MRGTGANQVIDQLKMYGSAVRWFCEAGVPEARPEIAGYWRSLACRPGRGRPAARAAWPARSAYLAFREPLVPGGAGTPAWPESLDGRPDDRPWTSFEPGEPTRDELEVPWTERGVVALRRW